MQKHHLLMITAMLVVLAACKPGANDALTDDAGTADVEAESGDASNDSSARANGDGRGRQPAPPGGAFARTPGFQLPVPVSSTPVGVGSVPQSTQVDPDGIRTALMEGMETAGANIQVVVNPGGIVSLSGEVASVAEMQRAHYLARAQPGVVEVDYRQIRVRQR